MAKLPLHTELLDTESLLPALASPDHVAVLMISEHLFALLGTLWYDQLPEKKLLSLNKNGKASSKDASELLEGFGPLASPSALTKICYLHGSICKGLYEGMEAVRSIRNSFAHSRTPMDLEHGSLQGRLERLAKTWAPKADPDKAPFTVIQKEATGGEICKHEMSWGRCVFFMSVGNMLGRLREEHFSGREIESRKKA